MPPDKFQWTGLDAWQANMIFTNLFTSHIGKPDGLPKPVLKVESTGPFNSALRANQLNAEAALKAVGGTAQRDPLSGKVIKLTLAKTSVSNDDLEHIALLFDPRELDLTDSDVTDEAWPHLVGWASLKTLTLTRTRLSAATVRNLKKYAPGLEIK